MTGVWPRLASPAQRRTAIAGALIALALIPVAPPGVPILASMFGVAVAALWPPTEPASSVDEVSS